MPHIYLAGKFPPSASLSHDQFRGILRDMEYFGRADPYLLGIISE